MHTIEEQERAAYAAGDTALAALAAAAAAGEEAQDEIAHLKRILVDALADDTWRERAQAAIAD